MTLPGSACSTRLVAGRLAAEQAAVKANKSSSKLSYLEKREHDNLPKEIEKLEVEKKKLEEAGAKVEVK